jgi:hypothetical protein
MSDGLTYEERNAIALEKKKKIYSDFQEKLKLEQLNLHGFEIRICEPEREEFNTNRGFFTSAYITFKGISFGHVVPSFNENFRGVHGVDNLVLIKGSHDHVQTINYSIEQGEFKGEEFSLKREHDSLQSCLDELERLRQEIVKFYSI